MYQLIQCSLYPRGFLSNIWNEISMINREWQRLTMDTIASCAFGIDANALTDNDSAFLYRCRRLFKDNETKAGIMKILIPLSCKYQYSDNEISYYKHILNIHNNLPPTSEGWGR